MKSFIAFSLLLAAALALPADKDITIVRQDSDNIGVGPYSYAYETSDKKVAQETGVLKNVGTENEALEVRGQYSYVAPDGLTYTVTYVANELGFQPQAAHLPVAPTP